jgi:hypothetical protein
VLSGNAIRAVRFFREGTIILHEPVVDADFCHFLFVVTFKEISFVRQEKSVVAGNREVRWE